MLMITYEFDRELEDFDREMCEHSLVYCKNFDVYDFGLKVLVL